MYIGLILSSSVAYITDLSQKIKLT